MNDDILGGVRLRLATQSFAVLSTRGSDGAPHSTIVCFASADEGRTLLFVTPRSTRKFANILASPEVTLMVDDRTLFLGDLKDIWGIEARGPVEVVDDESSAYRQVFLAKFPDMADFVMASSSALCRLRVRSYDVVHRFQEVMRVSPEEQP